MEINQNFSIKIKLLDINPSLKEIDKNYEEISIIFQGINAFYNLKTLLATIKEITISNCKNSIIFSLIKKDCVFASALFNIKFGEFWVKFNLDNKKINKSILYDSISIKIFLSELKINNSNQKTKNNSNKQLSRTIFQNKYSKNECSIFTLSSSNSNLNGKLLCLLTEEGNSKNRNKDKICPYTTINKNNEHKKIDFTDSSNKTRNTHSNYNQISSIKNNNFINNPQINKTTLKLNNKYIINNNDLNKNSILQFDTSKKSAGNSKSPRIHNNTRKSYFSPNINFEYNTNGNLFKYELKNKIFIKNNKNSKQRNTINSNSNALLKKNQIGGSLYNLHEDFSNTQKIDQIKYKIAPNSKKYIVKTEPKHKKKNKSEIPETLFVEKENNNLENENDVDYDIQTFLKMKDDFITLYNEEYVNNVQDDLLKLEIELMVEKICQLFFVYHNQENEKKIEYEILQNKIKINANKLLLQKKLKIKLELLENIFDAKQNQKNKNEFNKQKTKSIFSANENEFNFFRGIVKVDKYDRFKKIIEIILSNNKCFMEKVKNLTTKKLNKKNTFKKYKNDIPKTACKRNKKGCRENSTTDKIDTNNSIIDNYKKNSNNRTMIESPLYSGKRKKSYKSKYNTSSGDINLVNIQ